MENKISSCFIDYFVKTLPKLKRKLQEIKGITPTPSIKLHPDYKELHPHPQQSHPSIHTHPHDIPGLRPHPQHAICPLRPTHPPISVDDYRMCIFMGF